MRWNVKRDAIPLLSIAASVGLSLYFLPGLPEQVPTHFGVDGTADSYAPKGWAAAFAIGGTTLLYLLLTFIPRIDPFWKKIQPRYDVLLLFRDIVMLFMVFLFVATVLAAPTGKLDMHLFGTGFGLLFIVLGNYLPRLPRNFFFGIRNPWTIASEEVWKRTHIVSGWLFVAGGIVIILLSLLGLPMHTVLLSVLVPLFLYTGLVYPYLLFRKLQRRGESGAPDI
jgi:uncharacterized membrane protein